MYSLRRLASSSRKQFKSGISISARLSFERGRSLISVEPSSSLIDDEDRILVSGLKANQAVTLKARIVAEKGEEFESHAHFIACKDGIVDVYSDASLGGSYSGFSPMGLLWSMKLAAGQRKRLRLVKRDVTTPFKVKLECFDDHIQPNEGSVQRPLSIATFEKWYMADGVKRVVVNDKRFQGTLFIPPGDGPFPGVLDIRGGPQIGMEHSASLLASRGFVSLTLVYISSDKSSVLPPFYEVDYYEEAVEWLCKHPMVIPGGVGLHGSCLGSWIALLLASFRSDLIKAVVAASPTNFSHGFRPYKYRGKLSETFPLDKSKFISTEEGLVLRYALPTDNEDNGTSSTYSAIPPYQNISCPLLMIIGTGDLLMNVDFTARQVYERMKKNDKGRMCSIIRYPGAGHIFQPPYNPLCYSTLDALAQELCGNPYLIRGGDTEAHAQAQEDAWRKVLDFLRRNVSHN